MIKQLGILAILASGAASAVDLEPYELEFDQLGSDEARSISLGEKTAIKVTVKNSCELFQLDVAQVAIDLNPRVAEASGGKSNNRNEGSSKVTKCGSFIGIDSDIDRLHAAIRELPDCTLKNVVITSPQTAPSTVHTIKLETDREGPVYGIDPNRWQEFANDLIENHCEVIQAEGEAPTFRLHGETDFEKIKRAVRSSAEEGGPLKKLSERTFTIVASTEMPSLYREYSVGPGFSRLTDRVYYLEEQEATTEEPNPSPVIRRSRGAQDAWRFNMLAMAHFVPSETSSACQLGCKLLCGRLGLAAGIGTDSGEDFDFFFGPTLRLGGYMFLSAGWHSGQTTHLPAGDRVGSEQRSSVALSDLPTRRSDAFFMSVTFNIGGNSAKNGFEQKFALTSVSSTTASN